MSVLLTSTIDIFGGFTRQELAEIIVDDRIVFMSMLVRRKPANDSQHSLSIFYFEMTRPLRVYRND